MTKTKSQRKNRYKRDPSASVSLALTDRDYQILNLVFIHRFIDSEQILALVGGGKQGLVRRLNSLFHAGYLMRPAKQQKAFEKNVPMIYGLATKGAKALAPKYDYPIENINWDEKNRRKEQFIEHTMMVTQIMVAIQRACQVVSGVEFIGPDEIVRKRLVPPSIQGKALSWKITAPKGRDELKRDFAFSVIPDGAFGLRITEGPKPGLAWYFLEADRSTEPVKRSRITGKSSFYKKLVGYSESWTQKLYKKVFGINALRILTVTKPKTGKRIESLIMRNKEIDPLGKGSRMFLFTTIDTLFDDLENPEKVFQRGWLNGRAEETSMIE